MLAAGFEIDGDAENTQRWLRSADPATVSALRDRDEDMVRLLPRQFVAPGVFAGLDATPGSTQTLDNIAGLPPAVLTVMAVTPERVFVSLAPRSTATIWPGIWSSIATTAGSGGWPRSTKAARPWAADKSRCASSSRWRRQTGTHSRCATTTTRRAKIHGRKARFTQRSIRAQPRPSPSTRTTHTHPSRWPKARFSLPRLAVSGQTQPGVSSWISTMPCGKTSVHASGGWHTAT